MSRYVDIEPIIESIYKEWGGDPAYYARQANSSEMVHGLLAINDSKMLELLKSQPVLDIVRCRDCEYWDPGSPMATVDPTPCRCRLRRETDATTAEDFCSYGRRKANE